MKVILKEDVAHLGVAGDEAIVAGGYARNYLLPKGLAVTATRQHLSLIESLKRKKEKKIQKIKDAAIELAEKINSVTCTITKKAGETDKLFGSVTSKDICEALKTHTIEIDKKTLSMDIPIKTLGKFTVPILLHPEVTSAIKILVVKEEEEPADKTDK